MKEIWRLPYEARKELWDAVGYKPSPLQLAAHLDPHRLKLVAGGERAGKSFWTAHEIATWLAMTDEKDLIWIVGPSYELSRPELQHLMDSYGDIGWINTSTAQLPANGQWTVWSRRGTKIETKTSTEVRRLAGVAPVGIAQVESAQQEFEAYMRCRGRVAQRRGPLIMSGTFESSRGYYAELFRAWQRPNPEGGKSFSLPTWSNLALFPGGREDAEIKALEAAFPQDLFLERFGAEPAPPSNLVFREFQPDIHIKECLFDKNLPVVLGVDPGYAGAYSVNAFQIQNRHVYHIDEIYEHGHTGHEVIDMCRERPWWPNVTHACADVASRAHNSDRSQEEVWTFYGKVRVFSQMIPIQAGITRHRTFLRDPASGEALLLHDPKCVNTIKEYSQYVYPKTHEGHNQTELPIDQFNHSLKNIAYMLVLTFGAVDRPPLGDVYISFLRE